MNRETELWKYVRKSMDFEVSNLGNVRTKYGKRLLQQFLFGRGKYKGVTILGYSESVHVLVLEAFDKARPLGMVAHHINGDSLDNRAINLEWTTHSNNVSLSKHCGGQPRFHKGEDWLMRRLVNSGIDQVFVAKMFKCSRSRVYKAKHESIKNFKQT